MNIARALHQLQETELAAEAVRDKMAAIEAEAAADVLAPERAAIERRQVELRALKHELKETTAQADDFSARIKLHEEKLYSGRIASPKELSTLQKDIELLKGHRSPFEDKALELMEAIDNLEKGIDRAEAALQRHAEALEVHRKKLAAELKTLGVELAEVETHRAAIAAGIPAADEAAYRLLRKQKGGRAVARLEQGACRGCGIAVTAAWLQRARAGEAVRCPSCGRILYLE
jgi:hypothetical protein